MFFKNLIVIKHTKKIVRKRMKRMKKSKLILIILLISGSVIFTINYTQESKDKYTSKQTYENIDAEWLNTLPPSEFMPYYQEAEREYGVDWYVLASIHYTETNYGETLAKETSSKALGHMQIVPEAWVGYNIAKDNEDKELDITNLDNIKEGNGIGVDASGNGIADPFNAQDSIHAAAKFLSQNGYDTDPEHAILAYNHDTKYVDRVVAISNEFKNLYN